MAGKKQSRKAKRQSLVSHPTSITPSNPPSSSTIDMHSAEPKPASSSTKFKIRQQTEHLRNVKTIDGGKEFSSKTQNWWAKIKEKNNQLWTWYQALPTIKKVLCGLIVIPIVVLIIAINLILVPLIAPFLPLIGASLIALAKLVLILTKFGAFAIYIGYKILKGLLGLYYCVSRTLTGLRAGQNRAQFSLKPLTTERAQELELHLDTTLTPLHCENAWKRLTLHFKKGEVSVQHPFLFSYLRYFLIGQIYMYFEGWKRRQFFLTLWKVESRAMVKDLFTFVGTTIFRPYTLGPHVSSQRILCPGDARIKSIQNHPSEGDLIQYEMDIPWRTWSFNRQWPFVHSQLRYAQWRLSLPKDLAHLSESELNWRSETVLETGEPVINSDQ